MWQVLTALAYKHFAEQEVEVAIIEVRGRRGGVEHTSDSWSIHVGPTEGGGGGVQTGLGGVQDATNVVPPASLAVAVLSSIGMEHQAALGGTLDHIVAAKAGIAKAGCPVRGWCHVGLPHTV